MKASMAVVATRTVAAGRTVLAREGSVVFDAMDSYETKKFTATTLEEGRKCAIRKASRFHKANFETLNLSTTYIPTNFTNSEPQSCQIEGECLR
jgi:hypothetical protein